MVEHKVASQIEFESLDDFIRDQNNYYAYFLDDCDWGINRRKRHHLEDFKKLILKWKGKLLVQLFEQ